MPFDNFVYLITLSRKELVQKKGQEPDNQMNFLCPKKNLDYLGACTVIFVQGEGGGGED